MPGRELDIRDGRAVAAAETSHGGSSSGVSGAVPVRVKGGFLEAQVIISDQYKDARAVIGGDKKDQVKVYWADGSWTLEWPEDAGGGVSGSTISFGNGSVQVNNFRGRRGSGQVFVNGVDVSSMMNGGHSVEQPTLVLYLPSGCTLDASVEAGSVYAPAARNHRHGLNAVSFSGQSADITTDCAVGTLSAGTMSGDVTTRGITGPVNVSTMSGDVEIDQAMGVVQAKTMSGDIGVTALDSVMVTASSMSGDVTVRAAGGARPMVNASSMTGRVRRP